MISRRAGLSASAELITERSDRTACVRACARRLANEVNFLSLSKLLFLNSNHNSEGDQISELS